MIRCKPGTDYTITGSLHPKTTTAQPNSSHRLRRANPGWSTPLRVATTLKRSVQSIGFEFRMSYTESVRSQATPSRPGVTAARRHRGANELTTTQPRPSCRQGRAIHATPSCRHGRSGPCDAELPRSRYVPHEPVSAPSASATPSLRPSTPLRHRRRACPGQRQLHRGHGLAPARATPSHRRNLHTNKTLSSAHATPGPGRLTHRTSDAVPDLASAN